MVISPRVRARSFNIEVNFLALELTFSKKRNFGWLIIHLARIILSVRFGVVSVLGQSLSYKLPPVG